MEPTVGDESLAEDEMPTFTSPVRISFYHTRKRLADMDGVSVKAAIDGLVACGVLADDTPKQVAEIRHYQTQGSREKTVIRIELIDEDA